MDQGNSPAARLEAMTRQLWPRATTKARVRTYAILLPTLSPASSLDATGGRTLRAAVRSQVVESPGSDDRISPALIEVQPDRTVVTGPPTRADQLCVSHGCRLSVPVAGQIVVHVLVSAPRYLVTMHWYARPEGTNQQLRVAPRLASWEKAAHPDQIRLRAYLDDTRSLVAASRINGPWALRLDVGLPAGRNLLDGADLDNFAFPLAYRLDDPDLASVWCTKQHGEQSFVRIEATREMAAPSTDVLVVRPTASYTKPAFKEEINAAVAGAEELPAGPVRLELAFIVGDRKWWHLWKPTIDSLEPLLGRDPSETRPWHPRDGRITELGMHLTVDPAVRYEVAIGIAAASA